MVTQPKISNLPPRQPSTAGKLSLQKSDALFVSVARVCQREPTHVADYVEGAGRAGGES